MFDIFYFGKKPNLFAHEKFANSLEEAGYLSRTKFYWFIYSDNDYTNFDFEFRPPPWEQDHIHVFPSQWQPCGDVFLANKYTLDQKIYNFRNEQKVVRLPSKENWQIPDNIDSALFDFSWHPNSIDPPYNYEFPTKFYPEGGPKFCINNAVQTKYVNEIVAEYKEHKADFKCLVNIESFDFDWHPHPKDPPYIYVFGNQWYSPEQMPTVEYHVPGATERKYLYEPQATLPATQDNWVVNSDVPVEFDFSWCPDPHDPPYIYVFGNQHWDGERSSTVEYHVPGATERKFVGDIRAKLSTLDIFYVDYHNPNSMSRYETLKEKYPHIQRIRHANSIMDTITRCCARSNTARFWVVSSKNNYNQFDFDWQPDPWQHGMTHIFPSQWNKWSDTFLINRWEFERNNKWAKSIKEFPSLNFVSNQQVHADSDGNNIYYVDHGNENHHLAALQKEYPKIKITRFVDNYLDTFKRIMSTADTEYVWIINSVCDYRQFDFTWHPEAWQSEMIHVFPSGTQKRGDTFYIHVGSFKKQMYELEILDWFNVINYCQDQVVPRYEVPEILYDDDTIVDTIKATTFDFPYAIFVNKQDETPCYPPSPCLWSAKDRIAEPLSTTHGTALIPRDVKTYLKTQVYDYPYINKETVVLHKSQPLDIVFISNGEPDEELMFHHTEYMTNAPVKWVRGINGRVAAYQAAARASDTAWFFAVFAKLQVVGNTFPWETWQPDYWQEPKHYIFNARNPVNGLEYGHQGMIAYNKKLVLANNDPGIDFTLSQPHESVPLLSGVAQFNQDPWTTWRTAFREVVKLKHFMATQPTLETEHRLDTWLTVASGDYSDWCLRGAQDAVSYYKEVDGDYNKLMLSFEWVWLRDRFNKSDSF